MQNCTLALPDYVLPLLTYLIMYFHFETSRISFISQSIPFTMYVMSHSNSQFCLNKHLGGFCCYALIINFVAIKNENMEKQS